MSQEGSRFLGFVAVVVALGLTVAVLGEKLLSTAAGPEGVLITHLKKVESSGLRVAVAGGELVSTALQFQRMSVNVADDGQWATVIATLDFQGEFRRPQGSPTRVSSLGVERTRFRFDGSEWAAMPHEVPRLALAVESLERRRQNAEKPAEGVDHYQSQAWYLRSERDEVLVSEDYRLRGQTPDRPIDEKATRRLTLIETDGGTFRFLE